MLSSLPPRYCATVWLAGLVAFVGVSAWLWVLGDVPGAWQTAILGGLVVGTASVCAFLRLMHREPHEPTA